MNAVVQFLIGAPSSFKGGPWGYGSTTCFTRSDYELPRQVWEMLLARHEMGEFAYVSRKPNEAQDVWPRPPGTEFTILVRPDSRLKRYSWVTPDYVMGVRMDHQNALYHMLSGSSEGITFPTHPRAAIHFKTLHPYSVQDRNVVISRPRNGFNMRAPIWFFNYRFDGAERHTKVNLPVGLDRIVEKNGWVFVEEGNAFVALRMATYGKQDTRFKFTKWTKDNFGLYPLSTDTYTLTEIKDRREKVTGKLMEAKEPYTPLIVEASRREHHATLELFMEDVLDNYLALKQIGNGTFIVEYRGCAKDAKILYMDCGGMDFPKIDGKYISYECPAFDSPYLKGAFGSGVVTLIGPISGEELVLDFNEIERREGE